MESPVQWFNGPARSVCELPRWRRDSGSFASRGLAFRSRIGLNGGSAFQPDEAFSFQVMTEDQTETDRCWDAIVGNGGKASECGWCKDRWGLSWQITPRVLTEAYTSGDRAVAKRAFDAMMTMSKIDVAKIEAAVRGN